MQEDFREPPTHLGGVARYVLQHLRPGPSAVDRGDQGSRPTLQARGLTVRAGRLARYLRVTEGDRIEAFRRGGVLPPTYPAVWETGAVLDLLRLAGYPPPLRGLVHLASERVQLRPLAASASVRLGLRIGWAERSRAGARVGVASEIRDAAGRLFATAELELLLRGLEPIMPTRSRERDDEGPEAPSGEWRTLRGWSLPASAGRRYAAVSGDLNPIHLFRATARPFGFRSQILHGCCVEAMVAHALVESVLDGDPAALRRLGIRFTVPLELPARATLQVADRDGGGSFRVVGDPADRPYAHGLWTGGVQG